MELYNAQQQQKPKTTPVYTARPTETGSNNEVKESKSVLAAKQEEDQDLMAISEQG